MLQFDSILGHDFFNIFLLNFCSEVLSSKISGIKKQKKTKNQTRFRPDHFQIDSRSKYIVDNILGTIEINREINSSVYREINSIYNYIKNDIEESFHLNKILIDHDFEDI